MGRRLILYISLVMVSTYLACSSQSSNQAQSILELTRPADGWKRNAEIREFTAGNLWEYINGAAEQFIVYGVQDVATTDYITDEGAELTVDVYRMKDPLNAFGVYSMERNSAGPFPPVGSEACWNGTSLFFYKGSCYVKMIAFDEDDALKPPILELAERIASVIPGEAWQPGELSAFPPQNLMAKSEKYYPANVLAQPFFSNGYTAQYNMEGEVVQAFVIFNGDEQAAAEAFNAYNSSLRNDGREFTNAGIGQESFFTTDSFYGKIVCARTGPVIAGAMGKFRDQDGKNLIEKLLENSLNMTRSSDQ